MVTQRHRSMLLNYIFASQKVGLVVPKAELSIERMRVGVITEKMSFVHDPRQQPRCSVYSTSDHKEDRASFVFAEKSEDASGGLRVRPVVESEQNLVVTGGPEPLDIKTSREDTHLQ